MPIACDSQPFDTPRRSRRFWLVLALCGCAPVAAQSIPGSGWSSFGVLPFHAYNFVVGKAPDRYVMYFTRQPANNIQGSSIVPGRAFSADLKTWTFDPRDVCATSGDLCDISPSRAGVLQLPDGRLRMFLLANGLSSAISSDGVVWTRETGQRFRPDASSIYERANNTIRFVSFVTLPDSSVRMYYRGGVTPGSPGTPAYYNNQFESGMILSALSKDNGLTWTRDPGVRINPLVQGPVVTLTMPDGAQQNQFDCQDFSAVTLKESGRQLFRVFCSGLVDGAVSYVSDDGLSFTLEGQIPADRGGPKALVMPDNRIWLIPNGPDGIADPIVYGPQSLYLNPSLASGPAFHSVAIGVTGTSTGPVTLEPVLGSSSCPAQPCLFHPEYFSFSPPTGTPPFTTILSYQGPSNYSIPMLVVHAKSSDAETAAAVYCMQQTLGRSDTSAFCRTRPSDLPMNRMNFAFSPGAPPSSQLSNILSLGGNGYPFTTLSSVPWATVSPATGTAPQPITVTVNPTGLAPGTYTGVVTISAEDTTEKIAVTAVIAAAPVITSVRNAASLESTIAPNSFITVFGSGFATSPVTWSPVTALPTALGGVRVTIDGKDSFLSYADSGQLNVLTPASLSSDHAVVEVSTPAGVTSATVPVAPVAPSWFSYTVGTRVWLAALFANTATLVAPSGSLGATASRSAKSGDYLSLYANGLGATTPEAPTGIVLDKAYPLSDLSRVTVTIGGKPATVQFAGLVSSGLYQVNVQVPAGIGIGELPVAMFIDGRPTQSGVTLNFQ
jgi:uncharacterized protein (TIGR03437 family)